MNITAHFLQVYNFLQAVENGKVYYMKHDFILTYDEIYGWLVCHDMGTCFGTDCHIETIEELERLYYESTGLNLADA